jgi:hypothetical protein
MAEGADRRRRGGMNFGWGWLSWVRLSWARLSWARLSVGGVHGAANGRGDSYPVVLCVFGGLVAVQAGAAAVTRLALRHTGRRRRFAAHPGHGAETRKADNAKAETGVSAGRASATGLTGTGDS